MLRRLGLLILLPAVVFAAPPPGIPDGWSDGYVYANGVRIHYYRAVPAGGKPVIVMVHGVTDIGLSWTTMATSHGLTADTCASGAARSAAAARAGSAPRASASSAQVSSRTFTGGLRATPGGRAAHQAHSQERSRRGTSGPA